MPIKASPRSATDKEQTAVMPETTEIKETDMTSDSSYSLPPTIGIDGHDLRMKRAPAFSFGSRNLRSHDDSPGPAYYVDSRITNFGRERTKAAMITGRPAPRRVYDFSPGPIYNSQFLGSPRDKRSPRYSIGIRSFQSFENHRPGPTAYNIPTTLGPRVLNYRGAPAASLRGRAGPFGYDHDWSKTPGPAAYGTPEPSTKKAPAVTLKGRTVIPTYKMVTPGPGAYDPNVKNVGNRGGRGFTIGVKHSDKSIPIFTLADVSN